MLCPKCLAPVRPRVSKNRKVYVDQCTSCSGVWLDRGELSAFTSDPGILLEAERGDFAGSKEVPGSSCPLCLDSLRIGILGKGRMGLEVEVEYCSRCLGVFFDRGELHAVMSSSLKDPKVGESSTVKANIESTKSDPQAASNGKGARTTCLEDSLQRVLDEDEEVIWAEKTDLLDHMLRFLVKGTFLCVIFFLPFVRRHSSAEPWWFGPEFFRGVVAVCFALTILYAVFSYRNIFFILTNKRAIRRSGFLGVDFASVDYKNITDAVVTVNPIQKLLGVGTLSLRTASQGAVMFEGIANPYFAYKRVKSLSAQNTAASKE